MPPKSPIAEAYRSLQTNIQFSSTDHQVKLICITSPGASEGKSTTCANLALTYAQMSQRVLLIDADLRCPTQHKLFGLSNGKGLSHMISMKEELDDNIHIINDTLHVLTTGILPPNPVELISSQSMRQFLKDIRERYDMVIIDTPPVGILTDASLLAAQCDGTLFVVASRKSSIDLTQKAYENLKFVGAKLIGSVMTMLPIENKNYSYYYQIYEEEASAKKTRKKWFRKKGRLA